MGQPIFRNYLSLTCVGDDVTVVTDVFFKSESRKVKVWNNLNWILLFP